MYNEPKVSTAFRWQELFPLVTLLTDSRKTKQNISVVLHLPRSIRSLSNCYLKHCNAVTEFNVCGWM